MTKEKLYKIFGTPTYKEVKNAFLYEPDNRNIENKQLIIAMTMAYAATIISFVVMLFVLPHSVITMACGIMTIAIPLTFCICGLLFKEKSDDVAKNICVVYMIIMVPIIWIFSGGVDGFAPTWMLFSIAFTSLVLNRKNRIIMFIFQMILFFSIIHATLSFPEIFVTLPRDKVVILTSLSVLITSLYVALTVTLQGRIAFIERKRSEEARQKLAESLHSQKLFTASMNHELRAPLNGVMGCIQMLMAADNLTPQQREIIAASAHSANAVVQIVNDLLDYAKMEAGEFKIIKQEIDLKNILDSSPKIFTNQLREKGLKMEVEIPDDTPCNVYADGTRIQQVINNLLSNAVKYTREGGILFSARIENSILKLIVKDTGEGISDDALEILFSPFKRINEEGHRGIQGTGLGLYVTHQLVESMGGEIRVETQVGEGTAFYVDIPIKVVNYDLLYSSERTKQDMRSCEGMDHLKILNVDDSNINIMIFERLVGNATGAKITSASSGKMALDILEKEQFDIIFLDHQMPEMDGLEVFEELKRRGNTIPVVIFTANTGVGYEQMYLEKGFDGFQAKPMKIDETIQNIKKILKV